MKKVGGIAGVLGHLTSENTEIKAEALEPAEKGKSARKNTELEELPGPKLDAAEVVVVEKPPQQSRYARRGRMPGQKNNGNKDAEPKVKASVTMPAGLLEDYRAWSWQLHCQLGDLITWALTEYQERHRRKKKTS